MKGVSYQVKILRNLREYFRGFILMQDSEQIITEDFYINVDSYFIFTEDLKVQKIFPVLLDSSGRLHSLCTCCTHSPDLARQKVDSLH